MSKLAKLADQFVLPGEVQTVQAFGAGIINDTYLVSLRHSNGASSGTKNAQSASNVILQKINRHVFPNPEQIIANYRCIYDHINEQVTTVPLDEGRGFHVPTLYRTSEGRDYYLDDTGDYWRATRFVENSSVFDTLQSLPQAEEVGYALGLFHHLLSNVDISRLNDTLPGFHVTPQYLGVYDALDKARLLRSASQHNAQHTEQHVAFCVDSIEAGRPYADVLERAKQRLSMHVIHGDPKLNNILFNQTDGRAVSLIDLDTVKPGLIHYDLGDCLRSCCNMAGEAPLSSDELVEFDVNRCRAILTGYSRMARAFLQPADYEFMYDAIWLLPYELGLRFFSDYLQGNIYFKVTSEEQNLHRAHTQFQLLRSIQRQRKTIQEIIVQLKNG